MKTVRKWLLLAVAAVATGVLAVPTAEAQRRWGQFQENQWEELDNRSVAPGTREITLPVGRREGKHTAIRLRVMDDPIFIRQIRVTYGNGTQTEIPIRRLIRPGETTEPIDLEGDARFVREVNVEFRQDSDWRRTARLILLGDRVDARRDAPPPARVNVVSEGMPKDWVLFGTKEADFSGDRDIIRVGRERGRFEKIVLRVTENEVFVRDIIVKYGNGEVQDFALNTRIRPNSRTAELKLDRPHHIETIELVYSSRPQPGARKAVVEVWGDLAQSFLRGEGRGEGNGGWFLIGSKSSSMLRSDSDNFPVGERFGRISQIQLTARNADVEIRTITLTYKSGDQETLPVNLVLRRGASSPVFTLKSRQGFKGRSIESVSIRSKSQLSLRGDALVEVWAMP